MKMSIHLHQNNSIDHTDRLYNLITEIQELKEVLYCTVLSLAALLGIFLIAWFW